MNFITKRLKQYIDKKFDEKIHSLYPFPNLNNQVIELNNYKELMKVFSWSTEPVLDRPDMLDFDYIEDVNGRRIRDSESIATVMANVLPKKALEIGTANGMATVLMAANSPESQIYTLNISPEELNKGIGGKSTTAAFELEKIGEEYKKRKLQNIIQIIANTATWKPDISEIEVAFIDGCHDTEFIINDTKKVMSTMKEGGFILWHDFNLDLSKKHRWIGDVCLGVEKLYEEGVIKNRIFHLKDSWVGIYKI